MRSSAIFLTLALAWSLPSPGGGQSAVSGGGGMVAIPAGSYVPHYARETARVDIPAFRIDRHPVTRGEYAAFLRERPDWRRGAVKSLFASQGYLSGWAGEMDFGGEAAERLPVTEVSWFASRAYCQWRGARLPTLDEWEFVAVASETERDASRDRANTQRMLDLATARSAVPRPVGSGFRNVYGVHDMHGLVNEWVLDFNSLSVTEDSRGGGQHDQQLYCAAGGVRATDPSNYPAFLRFAMRGGLDGRSTVRNLGFRCAR
jgi:formylglycine-generating enzyme